MPERPEGCCAQTTPVPFFPQSVAGAVAGFGIVQAGVETIAQLRRKPLPSPGKPLSPSFLKHADDQTVAGLAAVYQAMHQHCLTETDFSQWGVIAAPSLLGRLAIVRALQRFTAEGAWGISPHLIPHHSLHAISGTVSQALKIYGPNFGVGGTPGAVTEAIAVTAALLSSHDLPGLWVILTENDPELVPPDPRTRDQGRGARDERRDDHVPDGEPLCLALALALVSSAVSPLGLILHLCPFGGGSSQVASGQWPVASGEGGGGSLESAWASWPPLGGVSDLIESFSGNRRQDGRWRLGSTGWLRLENQGARGEGRGMRGEGIALHS